MEKIVGCDSGCSVAAAAGEALPLSDAAVTAFLAANTGAVLIEVSTQECVPCRLLKPIVRKLTAELAGRLAVTAIDETATGFNQTYRIDRFPQLLFFVNGRYHSRQRGFKSAARTRRKVLDVLGIAPAAKASLCELAFRKACARARARMDAIMAPASAALEPHIVSTAPVAEKFEAAIEADRAAGRIDADEANQRRRDEYARLYAPFQDKIAALRVSQTEALAIYEAMMDKAVREFTHAIDRREAA
jgi:thioredoxin-like negative regulator of GroEL